ncbi:hypothetical protein BKA80DRAFT_264953 [Phyllosticta citrichinensis]
MFSGSKWFSSSYFFSMSEHRTRFYATSSPGCLFKSRRREIVVAKQSRTPLANQSSSQRPHHSSSLIVHQHSASRRPTACRPVLPRRLAGENRRATWQVPRQAHDEDKGNIHRDLHAQVKEKPEKKHEHQIMIEIVPLLCREFDLFQGPRAF